MASFRWYIAPAVAVCFAVASAQEAPQPVLAAVNATNAEFVQHWNEHQPAAIAALFKPDALFVAPPGTYIGRQGVQQYYEKLFSTVHPSSDFTHDIDRVETLSNGLAIAIGHWSLSKPALKGFWSAVYEHEGSTWEMRAHTYNITPP
jgi:uncharacterized protein (TIGR02246 family)